MATVMTSDGSTDTGRSDSNDLFLAVAGIHLLLGIAAAAAGSANVDARLGFTWWTGASVFVPLALTPVIAHIARTRQPWVSLAGAIVLAFAGSMMTLTADTGWTWITGATMSQGAALTAAAVLLVTAWRSSPQITALLAGAFVLSETLARVVVAEYFRQVFSGDADFDRGFAGLEYMSIGSIVAASLLLFLARTTESSPQHEHGLAPVDRIAAVLAIGGIAFALTHRNVTDGTTMIVIGLVIFGAGVATARMARVNGWTDTVPFHLDVRIVMLCGAAVACLALIDLADLAVRAPVFDGPEVGLDRALDVVAVVSVVPAIVLAARFPKIVLSSAALLGAAYGAVRLLDLLGDERLGFRWLLGGQFIGDLALAILLGGTVALALRRTDHASIEVGVIVFLAGALVVRGITNEVGLHYLGDEAIRADDPQPFRMLTIVGAVGLAALAIWWAGAKPSPDRALPER